MLYEKTSTGHTRHSLYAKCSCYVILGLGKNMYGEKYVRCDFNFRYIVKCHTALLYAVVHTCTCNLPVYQQCHRLFL